MGSLNLWDNLFTGGKLIAAILNSVEAVTNADFSLVNSRVFYALAI